MHDPVKQPKNWRDRAKATRAKAKQLRYAAPREMCRLLRVAEEYDKLGERYAEWQGSAQLPAAEAPERRSAPRIVADVVTRLEIRLAPTFGAGRFRQERNIRKS